MKKLEKLYKKLTTAKRTVKELTLEFDRIAIEFKKNVQVKKIGINAYSLTYENRTIKAIKSQIHNTYYIFEKSKCIRRDYKDGGLEQLKIDLILNII